MASATGDDEPNDTANIMLSDSSALPSRDIEYQPEANCRGRCLATQVTSMRTPD